MPKLFIVITLAISFVSSSCTQTSILPETAEQQIQGLYMAHVYNSGYGWKSSPATFREGGYVDWPRDGSYSIENRNAIKINYEHNTGGCIIEVEMEGSIRDTMFMGIYSHVSDMRYVNSTFCGGRQHTEISKTKVVFTPMD